MGHKKRHGPPPVPPANQPVAGSPGDVNPSEQAHAGGGAPFQDHDPKRRIGGFESAGEHARQQPSQINDGQQHSR